MSEDRTVRLHRVIKATPEKAFRAFVEPDALTRWMPPHGFTAKVHEIDARQGGTFRMSFTNFTTGSSHTFGGEYLEFVPGQKLRTTDRFDDPNLPGTMIQTITFKPVACGCEIEIVQENVPAGIPLEFCYLGWQESLEHLTRLVEPEIPDGV